MAFDLHAALVALATAAGTAVTTPRLTAYPFMPDQLAEPAVFVADVELDWATTFAGRTRATVTLRVLVSRTDDEAAQHVVDDLMGTATTASLRNAVMSARGDAGVPALAGAADDLWVSRAFNRGWFTHNEMTYLGFDLEVKITGDGST